MLRLRPHQKLKKHQQQQQKKKKAGEDNADEEAIATTANGGDDDGNADDAASHVEPTTPAVDTPGDASSLFQQASSSSDDQSSKLREEVATLEAKLKDAHDEHSKLASRCSELDKDSRELKGAQQSLQAANDKVKTLEADVKDLQEKVSKRSEEEAAALSTAERTAEDLVSVQSPLVEVAFPLTCASHVRSTEEGAAAAQGRGVKSCPVESE